ncbi:uncharacterized protein JCM10292_001521 [Rhodotorula paludigena]|uniref:uncharacterized protein n=1 Tax=Rhodotorula paludigena TaxID=86838 RepID=UPI00318001AD
MAAPAASPTSPSLDQLHSPPVLAARFDSAAPAPRPASVLIHNVKGAEGGVEAITARRRNSGSFKHMSTGGLVSNSPFAKRLGQNNAPAASSARPVSQSFASNPGLGLYTSSRIPTASANGTGSLSRRTSGSRRVSGEHVGPVKENSNPSDLNELGLGGGKADDSSVPRSRSTSPGVPLRAAGQATGAPSSLSPSKVARPAFGARTAPNEVDPPRRQTASFAHLRKNNLVSSSPFTATKASPELQQAPYEIGSLSHESAPFGYYDEPSTTDDDHSPHLSALPSSSAASVGLGVHPGPPIHGGQTGARVVAGASVPPPNTPPATERRLPDPREASRSPPPQQSAMSPVRRGMRGPRPLSGDGGDETDRAQEGDEEPVRTVRRQASSKSVAWAETEEVFEFEVEEERRRSMMSDASTLSDEGRYAYGRGAESSEEDELDDDFAQHRQQYSFEEGGSIEVHDVRDVDDGASDADNSVVSSTSSAMDEVIGQIDHYLHEESYDDTDVFSPSQIPSFSDQPDLPSHRSIPGYSSPQIPQAPQSAFSVSSVSGADDVASDVMSTSAYDDDDDDLAARDAHFEATRAALLARNGLAPMSPPRPPLPMPPVSPVPPPAKWMAPPALPPRSADPIPSATLVHSDSQYSLPDIPGTSPFLGFDDDGAAGSVVSLGSNARPVQAIPTTLPLQPQPHKVAVIEPAVTAVKAPSSVGSPIMSAMHRTSESAAVLNVGNTSPALSRKASIVGSDAGSSSVSWYGSSVNGSLRGGTIRLGRDRLEEKMKAHQALFGATDAASPVPSFGAFPTSSLSSRTSFTAMSSSPTKSTPPTSVAIGGPTAPLSPGGRAIEARPAPKARSATFSSDLLPTLAASPQRAELGVSVGSPLTARAAEEMQSPLERLQVGMAQERSAGEWRIGDSLLGVAEAAEGSEGDETEREDEVANLKPQGRAVRPARRRSRSTGDADLAETSSVVMQEQHTMPELGFERRADDAAFGSSVLESLDDIYNSRNRTYRVRESKQLVVVSDFNGHKAGDVDPGRAWRKKRPSDVHAINRSVSTMSVNSQAVRKNREFSGQLFVLLRDVTFEGMPLPRQKAMVTATLDNGRQRVDAAVRELSSKVSLRKEFELVCDQALVFSIHFSVPRNSAASTPVIPTAPTLAATPPPSPSKAHRAFRIFSSPKKKQATPTKNVSTVPPPTPDPFYDYVSSDGQLATAKITWAEQAAKCRLKKTRVVVPFGAKTTSSPRTCSGSLTLDLLFVPSIPSIAKSSLPKSMDEVIEGLELSERATKIAHESVLTQLGGDTTVWRRRIVKLRGGSLVPYSEVTKRSHVEINLSHVVSVDDLNSQSAQNDEDALGRMDNSFRLVFQDGNEIDFFADTAEVKAKWLDVLANVVGKGESKTSPPEWAVAVRKLPAPKALA